MKGLPALGATLSGFVPLSGLDTIGGWLGLGGDFAKMIGGVILDAIFGVFGMLADMISGTVGPLLAEIYLATVLQTPTPLRSGDLTIIRPPTNSWGSVYTNYYQFFIAGIAIALILYVLVNFIGTLPYTSVERSENIRGGLMKYFIFSMFGLPIIFFAVHLANGVIKLLAPSKPAVNALISQTVAGMAAASASPFAILTTIVSFVSVGVFIITLALYEARRLIIPGLPMFAPLIFAAYCLEVPVIKEYAKSLMSGWVKVLIAPIFVSMILKMATGFLMVKKTTGGTSSSGAAAATSAGGAAGAAGAGSGGAMTAASTAASSAGSTAVWTFKSSGPIVNQLSFAVLAIMIPGLALVGLAFALFVSLPSSVTRPLSMGAMAYRRRSGTGDGDEGDEESDDEESKWDRVTSAENWGFNGQVAKNAKRAATPYRTAKKAGGEVKSRVKAGAHQADQFAGQKWDDFKSGAADVGKSWQRGVYSMDDEQDPDPYTAARIGMGPTPDLGGERTGVSQTGASDDLANEILDNGVEDMTPTEKVVAFRTLRESLGDKGLGGAQEEFAAMGQLFEHGPLNARRGLVKVHEQFDASTSAVNVAFAKAQDDLTEEDLAEMDIGVGLNDSYTQDKTPTPDWEEQQEREYAVGTGDVEEWKSEATGTADPSDTADAEESSTSSEDENSSGHPADEAVSQTGESDQGSTDEAEERQSVTMTSTGGEPDREAGAEASGSGDTEDQQLSSTTVIGGGAIQQTGTEVEDTGGAEDQDAVEEVGAEEDDTRDTDTEDTGEWQVDFFSRDPIGESNGVSDDLVENVGMLDVDQMKDSDKQLAIGALTERLDDKDLSEAQEEFAALGPLLADGPRSMSRGLAAVQEQFDEPPSAVTRQFAQAQEDLDKEDMNAIQATRLETAAGPAVTKNARTMVKLQQATSQVTSLASEANEHAPDVTLDEDLDLSDLSEGKQATAFALLTEEVSDQSLHESLDEVGTMGDLLANSSLSTPEGVEQIYAQFPSESEDAVNLALGDASGSNAFEFDNTGKGEFRLVEADSGGPVFPTDAGTTTEESQSQATSTESSSTPSEQTDTTAAEGTDDDATPAVDPNASVRPEQVAFDDGGIKISTADQNGESADLSEISSAIETLASAEDSGGVDPQGTQLGEDLTTALEVARNENLDPLIPVGEDGKTILSQLNPDTLRADDGGSQVHVRFDVGGSASTGSATDSPKTDGGSQTVGADGSNTAPESAVDSSSGAGAGSQPPEQSAGDPSSGDAGPDADGRLSDGPSNTGADAVSNDESSSGNGPSGQPTPPDRPADQPADDRSDRPVPPERPAPPEEPADHPEVGSPDRPVPPEELADQSTGGRSDHPAPPEEPIPPEQLENRLDESSPSPDDTDDHPERD